MTEIETLRKGQQWVLHSKTLIIQVQCILGGRKIERTGWTHSLLHHQLDHLPNSRRMIWWISLKLSWRRLMPKNFSRYLILELQSVKYCYLESEHNSIFISKLDLNTSGEIVCVWWCWCSYQWLTLLGFMWTCVRGLNNWVQVHVVAISIHTSWCNIVKALQYCLRKNLGSNICGECKRIEPVSRRLGKYLIHIQNYRIQVELKHLWNDRIRAFNFE